MLWRRFGVLTLLLLLSEPLSGQFDFGDDDGIFDEFPDIDSEPGLSQFGFDGDLIIDDEFPSIDFDVGTTTVAINFPSPVTPETTAVATTAAATTTKATTTKATTATTKATTATTKATTATTMATTGEPVTTTVPIAVTTTSKPVQQTIDTTKQESTTTATANTQPGAGNTTDDEDGVTGNNVDTTTIKNVDITLNDGGATVNGGTTQQGDGTTLPDGNANLAQGQTDDKCNGESCCKTSYIVVGVTGALIVLLILAVLLCLCRKGRARSRRIIVATAADVDKAIRLQQEKDDKKSRCWPSRSHKYRNNDRRLSRVSSRVSRVSGGSIREQQNWRGDTMIELSDAVQTSMVSDYASKPRVNWGSEAVKDNELYVIAYDDEDIRYVQPYKVWILVHGEEPFDRIDYGRDITDNDRSLVRIPLAV